MSLELDIPRLDLPKDEIRTRFDALQGRLVPLWKAIESLDDDGEQTIVVVPSLTVDFSGLEGSLLQAYEERFLFLLLLLRQPNARLVYVTSQPVHPNVVDYYLGLLPGVIGSHARRRLFFVAPNDGAGQPLSVKLLQRPNLLRQIRALIPDPRRAHLVPFNTTVYERDLALRLGIPLYGADPRHLVYGTKSGCRQLFRECGVSHPAGFEDLRSVDDLIDATIALRRERPDMVEAMVKHNEGVSGEGNAVLDLRDLDGASRDAVRGRLDTMRLETKAFGNAVFLEKFAAHGGIVEERLLGSELKSPSAQLRITPVGEVQLISTHDQLLGGSQGQKYIGCLFPADKAYASLIARESLKVGERLGREKVLGRLAIDFICARTDQGWRSYAIEINLRKGGTTHPYLTLQFLTDGSYDAEAAEFRTPSGQTKCYLATDALESPSYRAFTPDDLFDIAVRQRLHYDQSRQTGIVYHMMSAVGDHGRLGLTAVANTRAEATALYKRTQVVMDEAAKSALKVDPLPM